MSENETDLRVKQIELIVDGMKHLTTITAGSFAIIVAFINNMRTQRGFIGTWALTPLLISRVISILAIALAIAEVPRENQAIRRRTIWAISFSIALFLFGIMALLPVAWKIVSSSN